MMCVAKIQEEVDEVREVVAAGAVDHERAEEEMGDLFFAIANLSRKLGIEPETALRKANAKFASRFTAMETRIADRGQQMHQLTFDEWDAEWNAVKGLRRQLDRQWPRKLENTKHRARLAGLLITKPRRPRSLEGHEAHDDARAHRARTVDSSTSLSA